MVVVVNLLYGVFLPRHINPGVCVSYITKPSAPFTPSQLNPIEKVQIQNINPALEEEEKEIINWGLCNGLSLRHLLTFPSPKIPSATHQSKNMRNADKVSILQ